MGLVRFRAGLIFFVLAVTTMSLAAASRARDDIPPKLHVRLGGEATKLTSWSSTDVFDHGGSCSTLFADGVPTWRPVIAVDHRHAAPRLVFHSPQRPTRISVDASTTLRQGFLSDPKRLDVDLQPRRRHGRRVAWIGAFRIGVPHRRFVNVSAAWRDPRACTPAREEASWDFELTRVP
jgi:hypothetical protein